MFLVGLILKSQEMWFKFIGKPELRPSESSALCYRSYFLTNLIDLTYSLWFHSINISFINLLLHLFIFLI